MLIASTGNAARFNFATVGGVLAKHRRIFVVNKINVILAELTLLTTRLFCKIGHFNLNLS
jgi:hypothetical protein